MSGARILLIEDDPSLCEALSMLLSLEDFDVETAANGKDAIQYLEDNPYSVSLIVTDLDMPIMNGWQFLEYQRQVPSLRIIPTIVMSASRNNLDKSYDFIAKPFDAYTLLALIRTKIPETQPNLIL